MVVSKYELPSEMQCIVVMPCLNRVKTNASVIRGKGGGSVSEREKNWTIHEDYNLQNVTNDNKTANEDDKADDKDSYEDDEADGENKEDADVGD
eukprot:11685813-Ditylum_brightwellii.AAC.1